MRIESKLKRKTIVSAQSTHAVQAFGIASHLHRHDETGFHVVEDMAPVIAFVSKL